MTRKVNFCFLSLIIASAALTGCGKGDAKVTPQLLRVSGSISAPALMNVDAQMLFAGIDVNTGITVDSLKVPIRSITLESSTGDTGVVYECAADSNDGCLVELTGGEALQNLLTGAGAKDIGAGTYDSVSIATCKSEGKYQGKIKATGTTDPAGGGTTLYTQAGSGELTSDVGLYAETTAYFSGCGKRYPLPLPVTVAEGEEVNVKLYFDVRDIAHFGNGASGTAASGAAFAGNPSFDTYPDAPTTTYVSVNYLDVAGTIDPGTPTIERYRLTSSDGFLGTVGLMFTSSGQYFGGFTRSYYDSTTTTGFNGFVTPVQTFTDNGDGTYTMKNYGSSSSGEGYFNTSVFKRAAASGLSYTEADGTGHTYSISVL
ncbi:MAG: hypothetical protein A2X94_03790 [Bdellovibrionales bacterium GWB1_55_8]|nr:MAG: hypothetical protein A2X94_03790 [Bdellovibrionales bacterium GWB1_55_8]